MKRKWEHHTEINKELLDSIKPGDLVKVNKWRKPLRVRAVSANYFVMAQPLPKGYDYSVCEKTQRKAGRHNRMTPGMFHCSTDHWLFGWSGWPGWPAGYNFEDTDTTMAYLESFEIRDSQLSERNGIPINEIHICRAGGRVMKCTFAKVTGGPLYTHLKDLRLYGGLDGDTFRLYGCHVDDEKAFYKGVFDYDQENPEIGFDSPEEVEEYWMMGGDMILVIEEFEVIEQEVRDAKTDND